MKIAILTPLEFTKAETFIKNHITNLPFEIVVVYGGNFPYKTSKNTNEVTEKRKHRIGSLLKRFLGLPTQSFQETQLRKVLKTEKVDVVFAEYLHVGAEVVEVCQDLKIPLTAIGLGYEISMYKMLNKYGKKYKKLFDYASTIFIVSEHMKQNIKAIGCDDAKIVCTPAGPSQEFLNLEPTFQSNQLLAVGRFVEKKAPYLTVLAFNEVLKKRPEATLIMAGDGELLQVCKDIANTLDITNAVSFVGKITPGQHQSLIENSIAFIQHSKIAASGDSEGTPVAILEAAAAGLPIIATIHAGIPNVVLNNATGFLVEENDVLSMAEKMISLLADKTLAKKMGAAGKTHVAANFTLEKHIATIATHLQNI